MRLDAHQHFWALKRGDYGWLTSDLEQIYRDFHPSDLAPILSRHGIDGTILVQAAPTVAETHYMLELAARHSFIKGVVGWVDFESVEAAQQIEQLARDPKLVGLRPMIQDIDDVDWMLREDLHSAFLALISSGLTFDALTLPQHLPNLLELTARYPEMRVVIDHGSKPEIRDGKIDDWAGNMARLASQTKCYCKISGLVTEASESWSVQDLKPYVDHLIDCFGPERLIWGSDWPVCTLAASYDQWMETTAELFSGFTPAQLVAAMGGNAQQAYKLP